MRLLNVGVLLFLVSCKTLPKIEWCQLNGDGSGECMLPETTEPVTKTPEELTNYICSSPSDLEKLINVCKKGK